MSRIASRDPSIPRLTARLSRTDLLWVANTAHGPGGHWHARVRGGEPDHDHLATPELALSYLADHGVRVPSGMPDHVALAELATVRTAVRRLVAPRDDPWTEECQALLEGAHFVVDTEGRIGSPLAGWPGFCRDLLLPLVGLAGEGTALGQCSNEACRLVFDDASRGHTRRWCDTAGCGNRDRVGRTRRSPAAARRAPARPVPDTPVQPGSS